MIGCVEGCMILDFGRAIVSRKCIVLVLGVGFAFRSFQGGGSSSSLLFLSRMKIEEEEKEDGECCYGQ